MAKCGGGFIEVYDDGLGGVHGFPCANTFFGKDFIQRWNLYP
jgi:hypothetical protein